MPNRFARGIPTEYGFELPKQRHALARPYIARPNARVLDFGCGNGANTMLFAPDAYLVVGVDVDPEYALQATAYAEEQGIKNLSYVVYDGRTLPFPDKGFENVVSFEVLEHPANDRQTLTEIRRVLKPGGVLAMSIPNKWYLMETHGFNLGPRWVKWNRVPLLSWLPTPIHERLACARIYSKRRIVRLLVETGFEVLEHRYIMPPFDRVSRPLPRAVLRSVFRRIEASPLRVIGVAHFLAARRGDHG